MYLIYVHAIVWRKIYLLDIFDRFNYIIKSEHHLGVMIKINLGNIEIIRLVQSK